MDNDNPCKGCGVCCMHMRTPPFVPDTSEWRNLSVALQNEVHAHAGRETVLSRALDYIGMADEAPCLWFDMRTGECREWERRPEVCRDFEVGGEACVKMRVGVGLSAPAPAGGSARVCDGSSRLQNTEVLHLLPDAGSTPARYSARPG
ncbi:hypothetical protein LCGC14_1098320 [marine sediment metagenome]|uniref:Zinc/iron-chelating domain-containing protein n=1 Tax=marine sediment metagenome TaxID=412755 RepID=A0A0F9QGD7_9ZZZZ